jgi:hypothetical protein
MATERDDADPSVRSQPSEGPAATTPNPAPVGALDWLDEERPRTKSVSAERTSYAWKIMLADALSAGVFAVGVAAGSEGRGASWPLVLGGLGSYALTPALIHGLNDAGPGRIAGSIALRLGCPALGFLHGMAALHPNDDLGGGPAGFALGAGLAMVVDWAALSWKTAEPAVARVPGLDSPWFAPTVNRDGRWALALGGRW